MFINNHVYAHAVDPDMFPEYKAEEFNHLKTNKAGEFIRSR